MDKQKIPSDKNKKSSSLLLISLEQKLNVAEEKEL
jgi:hypothetical protein